MKQAELVGKVQTVLGLIKPDEVGITLTHEHLLSRMCFAEPDEATERRLAHEPVKLENLWWVRSHSVFNLDNTRLDDEQLAIKEALQFKYAGGNSIVELSSIGMARDPLGLARISRATGLNIVMGAGYYISASHPPSFTAKSEAEITREIVSDILVGAGSTGIRAGIIGEIGCSAPLTDNERKVLRAAAAAQRKTGAALSVHASPNQDFAPEILSILKEAGADLKRATICHVDIWNYSRQTCRMFLDAGCNIEFDSIKTNAEIYPPYYLVPGLRETPSQLQVVKDIIELIGEGYLDQLLMTHDICMKQHLVAYGGAGYAHILRAVLPVMRRKGVNEEQIHTLLVENPKRVLQFVPAKRALE